MHSVREDILYIAEVIGAGEVAISDERSTDPNPQELARLVNDAYIGGMLSRKAGVTHFHVGDREGRLKPLRAMIDDYSVRPDMLYPTHIERSEALMLEAIDLSKRGAFVDIDTVAEDLPKWLRFFLDHGGELDKLTASSDASATSPHNLYGQIRSCVVEHGFPVEQVLRIATANAAAVLKLNSKGRLEEGRDADALVLRKGSLEIKDVIVGGKRIVEGDTTGPQSARTVLSDPAVEVAVLETARGGIIRRGLGYDWSDIGVMTNIGTDHIGQDGIDSVEDIVHIKALVAERVRAGGTLILNADDEHLVRLAQSRRVREPERNLIYFSLDGNGPILSSHVAGGGTAYYLKDGWIVEAVGNVAHLFVQVSDVPVTMNGAAEYQVANLMAAAAACRAYGLSREQVASLISSFKSDESNPGRANLYRVKNGHVMVDYGHNPAAFAAVCRMAARWGGKKLTGIIGVPGDRHDSVIEQAGRAAARGFHRLIIKEDHDLRGRRKGEVAEILCRAARAEAPATECLIVFDEAEALSAELDAIGDGQMVVIFYDKLGPVLEVLKRHGAQPATGAELEKEGPEALERYAAMMGGVRALS